MERSYLKILHGAGSYGQTSGKKIVISAQNKKQGFIDAPKPTHTYAFRFLCGNDTGVCHEKNERGS
jgi:isopentenyl phosphate kinase